jgi:hypothetical protein
MPHDRGVKRDVLERGGRQLLLRTSPVRPAPLRACTRPLTPAIARQTSRGASWIAALHSAARGASARRRPSPASSARSRAGARPSRSRPRRLPLHPRPLAPPPLPPRLLALGPPPACPRRPPPLNRRVGRRPRTPLPVLLRVRMGRRWRGFYSAQRSCWWEDGSSNGTLDYFLEHSFLDFR